MSDEELLFDIEDPRADLVRRLRRFENCRDWARVVDALPCRGRDWDNPALGISVPVVQEQKPVFTLSDIVAAGTAVVKRQKKL